MSDSGTVRSRRSRLHARGDHALCRHGDGVGPGPGPVPAAERLRAAPEPEGLALAVQTLPEPSDEAGRALVALAQVLAGRLLAAKSEHASASLAGQLRRTLELLERRAAPARAGRPSRLEQLRQARAEGDARRGWS